MFLPHIQALNITKYEAKTQNPRLMVYMCNMNQYSRNISRSTGSCIRVIQYEVYKAVFDLEVPKVPKSIIYALFGPFLNISCIFSCICSRLSRVCAQ